MRKPLVAVVSFPGNNCEVESLRAVRRAGMEALPFRWNGDRALLEDVDGYFVPGGFSYEDRGRSGMVAGRDPLMDFIGREAEMGKVVIGNCNGAQILVESRLIPLDTGLRMSLARNAVSSAAGPRSTGYINEWVHIRRSCERTRCATSAWDGVMHVPMAHGEGRFVSEDRDLFPELKKNGQLAFSYCDAAGNVSEDPEVTPNGSTWAVAGICNPAGNVVALMPHPERTPSGDAYFTSIRDWILARKPGSGSTTPAPSAAWTLGEHRTPLVEIFIGMLITNNEERTVEKAARRHAPNLRLSQWKYLALPEGRVASALRDLTVFNPNKERVFLRRGGTVTGWDSAKKAEQSAAGGLGALFSGPALLRRDVPDTGASAYGGTAETGVCYGCAGLTETDLARRELLEIFANPHASVLERIPA